MVAALAVLVQMNYLCRSLHYFAYFDSHSEFVVDAVDDFYIVVVVDDAVVVVGADDAVVVDDIVDYPWAGILQCGKQVSSQELKNERPGRPRHMAND